MNRQHSLTAQRRFLLIAWCICLALACGCESSKQPNQAVQPAPSSGPKAAKPKATAAGPRLKPAAPAAVMGNSVEGLGLKVDAPVPDATASDLKSQQVNLKALSNQGPVLLIFYRGGWCPYCNFQVRALAKAAGQFEALGVTPVLVSVDAIQSGKRTAQALEIPFPVLSDPRLILHRAFRVTNVLPRERVTQLKGHGMDLEASSGQTHHTVAHPAAFVLDKGKVRFSHVDQNYKSRPTVPQLIKVLRGLGYGKK